MHNTIRYPITAMGEGCKQVTEGFRWSSSQQMVFCQHSEGSTVCPSSKYRLLISHQHEMTLQTSNNFCDKEREMENESE